MNSIEKRWFQTLKRLLEKNGEFDNEIQVKEKNGLVYIELDGDGYCFNDYGDIENKLKDAFII